MKRYALAPLFFCMLGFAASSLASPPPLTVFVSVLPQKYFAERIGGSRATVLVMVGPGRSPATYEPTPKQMALLGGATLYFGVGVPFERTWLPKIAAANERMTVIPTGSTELHAPLPGAGTGDEHGHGALDPHLWTSPRAAIEIARDMAEGFAGADPPHAAEYRKRFETLAAELRELDREIHRIIDPLPRRTFFVFHPSWGAFAEEYGLEQVAIEQDGGEPGARHLAELIDMARRKQADTVFIQPQFDRRNAETVARAIGASLVSVDPLAEDYIVNLRAVTKAFAGALQ